MHRIAAVAAMCALAISCGPTGSYTPHEDARHVWRITAWGSAHGIPQPTYVAVCESSMVSPGPLYIDALDGMMCLATSEGGSVMYAYPRHQQSMAAEVMLAHEYGHHWLAVTGGEQYETTADCISGAYYATRHTRLAAWWASWMVPYRSESRAEESGAGHPPAPGERRRAFMRGVRGGVADCLD